MKRLRCVEQVEKVNGRCLSPEDFGKAIGVTRKGLKNWLSNVRRLPYVAITRTEAGITVRFDRDLYDQCQRHQPRATLDGRSLATEFAAMRKEITRRRAANHDERMKHRWNPEFIITRSQTELLDWIEDQLDALSADIPIGNRGKQSAPADGKGDGDVIQEGQSRGRAADVDAGA